MRASLHFLVIRKNYWKIINFLHFREFSSLLVYRMRLDWNEIDFVLWKSILCFCKYGSRAKV
jgi:hypothetical protein